MFTGIITGVGRIVAVHSLGSSLDHGKRLSIEAPAAYLDDVGLGDSIAINGACMTVTSVDPSSKQFLIEISAESLARTCGLSEPGPVNLEKALRAHDRLGGHIVAGHVDGIGTVTHFAEVGESWELRILTPHELGKYLAYKGSITVNGVSLTVNRVADLPGQAGCEISINLIPHTVHHTALQHLRAKSPVNLEIDLIARYVERMLGARRAWDVDSEKRPLRGQFLPDSQAHSQAMGPEDGEKWTAAADLQPTFPMPGGLPKNEKQS